MRPRTEMAVAAIAALAVWFIPYRLIGFWISPAITDIPTYSRIAEAIAGGAIPYRDVQIEYPPLATALFVVNDRLPGDAAATFEVLMGISLAATAAGVAACARRLALPVHHRLLATAIVALSPLLLGNVMKTRFDLVLAALIAWMVYAAITERWRLMWALLTAGVLLKLMPILLVPVLLVWQTHRGTLREAVRTAGTTLAVGLLAVLPLVILAPSGTWYVLDYHRSRPPQIESLTADYMLVLHWIADVPVTVTTSYGSQGLPDSGPRVIALVSTVAMVILVAAIAWTTRSALRRARRGLDARLLVAGVATTIAAVLATGKVLSPQFMVWLLPCTFLVSGRHRVAAWTLGVAALVTTQAYFPRRYFELVALGGTEIMLLTIRNAVLVGLVAACWPRPSMARGPRPAPVISRSPDAPPSSGPDQALPGRYIVD